MAINLNYPNGLVYNYTEKKFSNAGTTVNAVRYLKGIYTNKERFISRYMTRIFEAPTKFLTDEMIELYDTVVPYTFKEAFEIKDDSFKALVFGSINIGDMIDNLGATRVKTDGVDVKRKQFSEDGEFLGYKEYHNIYELFKVNGEKLGVSNELYVVKCWCTSTNKEHWLWVDEQYKECPLTAIASTFIVAKNIIPHITEIKRQGDILLVELDTDIEPNESDKRPLTKDEYFNWLTAES